MSTIDSQDRKRRSDFLQRAAKDIGLATSNADGFLRLVDISDEEWDEAQALDEADGVTPTDAS